MRAISENLDFKMIIQNPPNGEKWGEFKVLGSRPKKHSLRTRVLPPLCGHIRVGHRGSHGWKSVYTYN